MNESYKGWTNYNTYQVMIHFDLDLDCRFQDNEHETSLSVDQLSELIKEFIFDEINVDSRVHSFLSDVLTDVNWLELAGEIKERHSDES